MVLVMRVGRTVVVRNNKDATPQQRADAVPKANADKPVGQWNRMIAHVVGDRVTIILNGLKVIDNAQLPGLKHERGPIGLQHHGGPLPAKDHRDAKEGSDRRRHPHVPRLEPVSVSEHLHQTDGAWRFQELNSVVSNGVVSNGVVSNGVVSTGPFETAELNSICLEGVGVQLSR